MARAARKALDDNGSDGPAAPAIHTPKPSPAKVVVGCKVHVSAITLELCKPQTMMEEGLRGSREVTIHYRTGMKHVIRGLAYPAGTPPDGFPEKPQILNGYALTRDIPGEFWDEWVKQNARNPLVLNKMVIAFAQAEDIGAVGREQKGVTSGLEPIQRGKVDGQETITDKRVTRPTIAGISPLEGNSPGRAGSNVE